MDFLHFRILKHFLEFFCSKCRGYISLQTEPYQLSFSQTIKTYYCPIIAEKYFSMYHKLQLR